MAKILFILLLLAFFLPDNYLPLPSSMTEDTAQADHTRDNPGFGEVVRMIDQTRQDFGGLCDRKPEVCETGLKVGTHLRDRALTLTKAVETWLVSLPDDRSEPAYTGTHPNQFNPSYLNPSQHNPG